MALRIGIDLDNTIIRYDDAFIIAARARRLVSEDFQGGKQQLRAQLRDGAEGERAWQALQGYVYGQGMARAALYEGVDAFLQRAAQAGAEVVIVSHKTEFGHFDEARVNLRHAARGFLWEKGVFGRLNIAETALHFAATRAEKVERIARLACDVFIDDLREVFEEPHFPVRTKQILFTPEGTEEGIFTWQVCVSWEAISQVVFAQKGR